MFLKESTIKKAKALKPRLNGVGKITIYDEDGMIISVNLNKVRKLAVDLLLLTNEIKEKELINGKKGN